MERFDISCDGDSFVMSHETHGTMQTNSLEDLGRVIAILVPEDVVTFSFTKEISPTDKLSFHLAFRKQKSENNPNLTSSTE